MSLYRRLRGHAQFQPDKTAIDYEGSALSYSQLLSRVDEYSNYFRCQGLRQGDRVAFLALNHPDLFVAVFAAAKTGVILVPLNWRLSEDELGYMLDNCQPRVLIHDEEFADTASSLLARQSGVMGSDLVLLPLGQNHFSESSAVIENNANVNALHANTSTDTDTNLNRDLLIVYTSGTTGRPKGAVLNQKALLCGAEMTRHMLDLTASDRVLNVLPLFHVGGLNIQPMPALLQGATVYLHQRFNPTMAVRCLREQSINHMTTVPPVLEAMMAVDEWQADNLSQLKAITIGSTDVPVSLIHSVHSFDIPLLQVYGATETSPVAIYQRAEHADIVGTIGRAGLLCDVRLENENGQVVGVGESGEILVKGDNVLTSYWNDDAATQENISNGWFKTGDVAHVDANGFYWFDDRVKHVIISGGENIYPAELERLVRVLPGVEGVAVVGRADSKWGEVPVVVVEGDIETNAILKACSVIAKFKQPRDVLHVDKLPRTALGKIEIASVRDLVRTS